MTREEKHDVRRNLGRTHRFVLIYTLIFTLVTFAAMIIATAAEMGANGDISLEKVQSLIMQQSGLHSLVALAIGVLFILANRRSRLASDLETGATGHMTLRVLASGVVLLFSFQLLFIFADPAIKWIASQLGYTLSTTTDSLSNMQPTLTMFLYTAFLGPIVEEIIFRGVVMKNLAKYGKLFAIVVSAALFGIFHGDISQGLFAFCCGLLLGYIAMEYGFKWAIVFHIINNFLISDMLARFVGLLPNTLQDPVHMVVTVGFGLLGILVLLKNRRAIAAYIVDNRTRQGVIPVLWTVPSFWLFLLMQLAVVSMSFTKIG